MLGLIAGAAIVQPALTIDNIDAGDRVRHPVVILRGTTDQMGVRAGRDRGPTVLFPAFQGRYTAVVELVPGINFVRLSSGGSSVRMRVDYRPMRTPYKVHPIWFVASDQDPEQTPGGKLPLESIRRRIATAAKLMQSATAEMMAVQGFERKAFALDLDDNGQPNVRIIKSDRTGDQLRAMSDDVAWRHIYDTVRRELPDRVSLWAVLTAYPRWDGTAKRGIGHFALGGGQLAAFGGGSLAYFPESLAVAPATFNNRAVIDPSVAFEDSAGRRAFWANSATGIGAWLHELGHTFGLPHTPDPACVMSRGFDRFNRVFMAFEPRLGPDPYPLMPVTPESNMAWSPFHAARLNWNPWFQPDARGNLRFATEHPPVIELDSQRGRIRVTSHWGLRVLGFERDDAVPQFRTWQQDAPKVFEAPLSDWSSEVTRKPHRVVAIDDEGNQVVVEQPGRAVQ